MIRNPRSLLTVQFGRCPKCMRLSLAAMLLGWAGFGLINAVWPNSGLPLPVLLLVLGLTGLWFLHVVGFASRRVAPARRWRDNPHSVPANINGVTRLDRPTTRRGVLWMFLKGAAAATALSLALPRLAMAACGDCANAYGAGTHDCITNFCGTDGQICCPAGFPYLNHCDCDCYDTTNFDCGSYSACQYCG